MDHVTGAVGPVNSTAKKAPVEVLALTHGNARGEASLREIAGTGRKEVELITYYGVGGTGGYERGFYGKKAFVINEYTAPACRRAGIKDIAIFIAHIKLRQGAGASCKYWGEAKPAINLVQQMTGFCTCV